MAVEDGAVLGRLLGHFQRAECPRGELPELMRLYQSLRKDRTATVVKTATGNRSLYHVLDGPEQRERDARLGSHDWWDESASFPWVFGDIGYLHQLYGFDTMKSADEVFARSRLAQGDGGP